VTRWVLIIALSWTVFVLVPPIPAVRMFLGSPLVVEDRDARGDACYILAAADSFRERLGAAAELYNQGRVPKIIFIRDDGPGSYNFVAKASWTPTEWALDFLTHRGVPRDRIQLIDHVRGTFGTLQEAKNLKGSLPADVKRLVLVSSACLRFDACFPGMSRSFPIRRALILQVMSTTTRLGSST